MRPIFLALIAAIAAGFAQASEKDQKLPDYALPVVQNWLSQNSEVVEVCVFREQWIAPTKEIPKGVLLKFATITSIHKGSVKVGNRVVLTCLFEYPRTEWQREARLRPSRVSMVDGELMVCMFDKQRTPHKDGYWDVGSDISRFTFDDEFHQAFLLEKKRDPKLAGIPN
jgi:hypothetical protein